MALVRSKKQKQRKRVSQSAAAGLGFFYRNQFRYHSPFVVEV